MLSARRNMDNLFQRQASDLTHAKSLFFVISNIPGFACRIFQFLKVINPFHMVSRFNISGVAKMWFIFSEISIARLDETKWASEMGQLPLSGRSCDQISMC